MPFMRSPGNMITGLDQVPAGQAPLPASTPAFATGREVSALETRRVARNTFPGLYSNMRMGAVAHPNAGPRVNAQVTFSSLLPAYNADNVFGQSQAAAYDAASATWHLTIDPPTNVTAFILLLSCQFTDVLSQPATPLVKFSFGNIDSAAPPPDTADLDNLVNRARFSIDPGMVSQRRSVTINNGTLTRWISVWAFPQQISVEGFALEGRNLAASPTLGPVSGTISRAARFTITGLPATGLSVFASFPDPTDPDWAIALDRMGLVLTN